MKALLKLFLVVLLILVFITSLIIIPNNFAMTSAITNSENKIVENLESAFNKFYSRDFSHFTMTTENNGDLIFAEIIIKNKGNDTYKMRADIKINEQEHTAFYENDTVYSNLNGVNLKHENVTTINDALENALVLDGAGENIYNYSTEYSSLIQTHQLNTSLEITMSPFIFGQKYEIFDPVEEIVEKRIVVDFLNNIRSIEIENNTIVTIKNLYQKPDMDFPENFDAYNLTF